MPSGIIPLAYRTGKAVDPIPGPAPDSKYKGILVASNIDHVLFYCSKQAACYLPRRGDRQQQFYDGNQMSPRTSWRIISAWTAKLATIA
jgi:hypothetical protein